MTKLVCPTCPKKSQKISHFCFFFFDILYSLLNNMLFIIGIETNWKILETKDFHGNQWERYVYEFYSGRTSKLEKKQQRLGLFIGLLYCMNVCFVLLFLLCLLFWLYVARPPAVVFLYHTCVLPSPTTTKTLKVLDWTMWW